MTLPEGTDACDIGTITVWCQPFTAIFTRLAVPTSTFVSLLKCSEIPLFLIWKLFCASVGVCFYKGQYIIICRLIRYIGQRCRVWSSAVDNCVQVVLVLSM